MTPYLQEKLVLYGQSQTYTQAAELARAFLNLPLGSSQIYRLTTYYGQAIEADLNQPLRPESQNIGLVYVKVDGAMLLTEDGYKENKLGRVFEAQALSSPVEGRGGHLTPSLYAPHLGPAAYFTAKLTPHLDQHQAEERALVFLSDGAVWLRQWMSSRYPKARLILDIAHAMSYVGQEGIGAFGEGRLDQEWTERESKLLLDSELDTVLANIRVLKISPALRNQVVGYLVSNRARMVYKYHRERGWLIGSGAIESAHHSGVQHRLKRSGQRWHIRGGQRVLNLRVCASSDRWHLVRQHIEPHQIALAA